MNVLLDLVVCGPGARMCGGGFSKIFGAGGNNQDTRRRHQTADICIDDPWFWDRLAGMNEPPIPEVIDVINSGSDDTRTWSPSRIGQGRSVETHASGIAAGEFGKCAMACQAGRASGYVYG